MEPDDWFVLGAPWDSSGSGRGEGDAPAALRAAGVGALASVDLGDADCAFRDHRRDPATGVLALEPTLGAARALADALAAGLASCPERRPLVLGGDCSILLGIVPALRRHVGRVGLWFLDGHPDFVDGLASETGETADLELAVLTGASALPGLWHEPALLEVADVVLVGHRTHHLDPASAAEVARLPAGLARIDSGTVARDPRAAGVRAADLLQRTGAGAWLHLDVDVLDPAALPAVTYPQPGGVTWEALEVVQEPLVRSPRLLGISVADLRPDLDADGAGTRRLVELLTTLMTPLAKA